MLLLKQKRQQSDNSRVDDDIRSFEFRSYPISKGFQRDIAQLETVNIHDASQLAQINWTPGIGDPTIVGWFTVLAYFLAFLLSVACAKRMGNEISDSDLAAQRRLWWFIALALLMLGINKQLDLQTFLTEVGRILARRGGWYQQRRIVQGIFIVSICFFSCFSALILWHVTRDMLKKHWLTLLGLVFLMGFVMIRAASFHHMDRFLGSSFLALKMNWVLELGGIICIGTSAVVNLNKRQKGRKEKSKTGISYI